MKRKNIRGFFRGEIHEDELDTLLYDPAFKRWYLGGVRALLNILDVTYKRGLKSAKKLYGQSFSSLKGIPLKKFYLILYKFEVQRLRQIYPDNDRFLEAYEDMLNSLLQRIDNDINDTVIYVQTNPHIQEDAIILITKLKDIFQKYYNKYQKIQFHRKLF